jgi:hypothetical protein
MYCRTYHNTICKAQLVENSFSDQHLLGSPPCRCANNAIICVKKVTIFSKTKQKRGLA